MTEEELSQMKDLMMKFIQEAVAPEVNRQLDESRKIILDKINDAVALFRPMNYTRDQVCEKFDICKATFHNWVNAEVMKTIKISGRTYVESAEVDRLMEDVRSGKLKISRGQKKSGAGRRKKGTSEKK